MRDEEALNSKAVDDKNTQWHANKPGQQPITVSPDILMASDGAVRMKPKLQMKLDQENQLLGTS